MNTITISKKIIEINKEPAVILPLKKWKEIEADLEDLEMYRSENFRKEIKKRRKEKIVMPLGKILKKYHI